MINVFLGVTGKAHHRQQTELLCTYINSLAVDGGEGGSFDDLATSSSAVFPVRRQIINASPSRARARPFGVVDNKTRRNIPPFFFSNPLGNGKSCCFPVSTRFFRSFCRQHNVAARFCSRIVCERGTTSSGSVYFERFTRI